MIGSITIGSVFGITVRVHWMFVAMIVYLVATDTDLLTSIVMLFGIVFLHELGHSLAAKAFGLNVVDITFWPLGGMARMSEMPEVPRIEGLVAIAGPAVNFVLALLALPFVLGYETSGAFLTGASAPTTPQDLAALFVLINLTLGVFNLLPAFPMDGGRVLRAALGTTGDWVWATQKAVQVGRFFAFLMIAFGVFGLLTGAGTWFLPFIGVFIWFSGTRELFAVRLRHGLSPLGAVFGGGPVAPTDFGGGPPGAPGRAEPAGGLDEETGLPRRREPQLDWSSGARGFSEDEIERLESFKGRLGRSRSVEDDA